MRSASTQTGRAQRPGKAVAHAMHRDHRRLGDAPLDKALAHSAHKGAERGLGGLIIAAIKGQAGDIARHRFAHAFAQQGHKFEFFGRKAHHGALGAGERAVIRVQVPNGNANGFGRRARRFAARQVARGQALDRRREFARVDRLAQEKVGSTLVTVDARIQAGTRRQHNDGGMGAAAPLSTVRAATSAANPPPRPSPASRNLWGSTP